MKDAIKTIAVIAGMVGMFAKVHRDGVELDTDLQREHLLYAGQSLGELYNRSEGESGDADSPMSSFFEAFGNTIAEYKCNEQIATISEAFFSTSMVLGKPEADAFSFMEARMAAAYTGDMAAVNDVDYVLSLAIACYQAQRGAQETNKFINLFNYSLAGATLGYELALAKEEKDEHLTARILEKANTMESSLLGEEEFGSMFRKAFDRYAADV